MEEKFFKTELFSDYYSNDMWLNSRKLPAFDIRIDHPLSEDEYDDLRKFIDSTEGLSQVIFEGEVNPQTITRTKYIMERSEALKDKQIKKIVLKRFEGMDLEDFLSLQADNPETWFVAYREIGSTQELTDLSKYRNMEFVLSNIVNGFSQNNLSPLEKVMWAYDNVKTLQYVKKENVWDEKRIPEIIMDGKATCVGFGELFSEILNRCGINCYGVHTNTHEPHYRNIAEVSDEKYGINGIYMFDPTWDSVSYSNDPIIRLMPYDYFCRRISDLNLLKDKEDVSESLLGVLNSSSLEEAVKRAREVFPTQKDYGTRSLTLDENAITVMYNKATNAPKLSEEALAQCMAVVRSKQYPDFSKDKIVSWVEDSMVERERMQSKLYNDPIIEDRVMQ